MHRPPPTTIQAYFAPYPSQRHAELVAELQQLDDVQLSVLGQTLDGRDLDLLRMGARHCDGEGSGIWTGLQGGRSSRWRFGASGRANIRHLRVTGTPGDGKRVVWIIARQHPGETMAEWAAEGAVMGGVGGGACRWKCTSYGVWGSCSLDRPSQRLHLKHRGKRGLDCEGGPQCSMPRSPCSWCRAAAAAGRQA